jgi:O-antigen/teichoic acid export membrane protein
VDAKKQLTRLFTKVGRIQFMLLSLVLTGFILFGKPFILWWAGPNYEGSYYIAVVLLTAVTIPIIQNLGIEIQQALNMHKFRSILYLLIAICNILISIPLIYKYSGFGAAIGTAISLVIGNILIMNIFYHNKVGINMLYFWKEILKILPSVFISIILGYAYTLIFDINELLFFLIGVIGYSLVFAVSMFKIGMNKNEKQMIIKPIVTIYSFIVGEKND